MSAGVFVVQEHQATAHHYDLRLEVDGVMRSWAVPKGPSLDPAAKRLAVQVEDHGLDHNDFEGTLGDGGVVVWDRGKYEQGGRVAWPEAIERGHAVFVLHGEKLRGGFALQRTRPGAKAQWLLIKRRDDEARPGSDIVTERPESVISGRTLAELLGADQFPTSTRLDPDEAPRRRCRCSPARATTSASWAASRARSRLPSSAGWRSPPGRSFRMPSRGVARTSATDTDRVKRVIACDLPRE